MFADEYGQTQQSHVLFQQLWHWTEMASNIYSSKSKNITTKALTISLLDVNLEGRLQRRTKDIVDELDIILDFLHSQLKIADQFEKQAEHMLDPEGQWRDGFSLHVWTSKGRPPPPALARWPENYRVLPPGEEQRRQKFNQFRANAYHTLCRYVDRINEVEALKTSADAVVKSVSFFSSHIRFTALSRRFPSKNAFKLGSRPA